MSKIISIHKQQLFPKKSKHPFIIYLQSKYIPAYVYFLSAVVSIINILISPKKCATYPLFICTILLKCVKMFTQGRKADIFGIIRLFKSRKFFTTDISEKENLIGGTI